MPGEALCKQKSMLQQKDIVELMVKVHGQVDQVRFELDWDYEE